MSAFEFWRKKTIEKEREIERERESMIVIKENVNKISDCNRKLSKFCFFFLFLNVLFTFSFLDTL